MQILKEAGKVIFLDIIIVSGTSLQKQSSLESQTCRHRAAPLCIGNGGLEGPREPERRSAGTARLDSIPRPASGMCFAHVTMFQGRSEDE